MAIKKKAVKSAPKGKNSTKAKPVKKSTAAVKAKPAAKKPVAKKSVQKAKPAAAVKKTSPAKPAAKKPLSTKTKPLAKKATALKSASKPAPAKSVKTKPLPKAKAKEQKVKPAAPSPKKAIATKVTAKTKESSKVSSLKSSAEAKGKELKKPVENKPVAPKEIPAPIESKSPKASAENTESKYRRPMSPANRKARAEAIMKKNNPAPVAKKAPSPRVILPPAPRPTPGPAPKISAMPTTDTSGKTRYSDAELLEFKELIVQKLADARTELVNLQAQIINANENGTDDTGATFKMLEDGSDTLAKEEAANLAARQKKFIEQLEAALIRIENKTYGICRVTGRLIAKERLRAVPHTTQSMEAKLQQYKD